MSCAVRRGVTLFQLLVLLALLVLLFGLMLPAIVEAQRKAEFLRQTMSLRQIGLAVHNYHDVFSQCCPGQNKVGISGLAHLLPYLEQDNTFRGIDFSVGPDHKDNAKVRATRIPLFESPRDAVPPISEQSGPTNYFLIAGNKASLTNNNGMFFKESKIRLADVVDGLSNTAMAIESLRGDGKTMAVSVQRQHVRLSKNDLDDLKETAGVKEFAESKNIVGTRGSAWIDGRFLQTLLSFNRGFNDDKPDVDCGGDGGLSGPRAEGQTQLLLGDGSVRVLRSTIDRKLLLLLADRADGQPVPVDF